MFFSVQVPDLRAIFAMILFGAWCKKQRGILDAAAICCYSLKAHEPFRIPVNPFKGSIGLISHHALVPVQTVLIETDSAYLRKGWPLFRKPPMPINYRVSLGRRFNPPQNTKQFMAELEHYFAHDLVQGPAFFPTHSQPGQAHPTPS